MKITVKPYRLVLLLVLLTMCGFTIYANRAQWIRAPFGNKGPGNQTQTVSDATPEKNAANPIVLEPAQTGGSFDITKSTVAAGGGSITGGSNQLAATIGQSAVGVSSGGSFSLSGGFWNANGGCTFAIDPLSQNFPAAGGSGSVSVTTGAACSWTAISNDAWIVLANFGGTGNGSVGFMAMANTGAQRTGTITVAGQTFTVTQDAAGCPTITLNPGTLPNGFAGVSYPAQTFSAGGGISPYSFSVVGALPSGLTLVGNVLSGTPATTGSFPFSIKAADSGGCMGTQAYTVVISGDGTNSLMFYPLSAPVRLLDTRAGQTACTAPGVPITGGSSFLQTARGTCGIPASAKAVTGNVTVVLPGTNGFLTIYPSDAMQPTVANTNFIAGDVLNNVFTTGLGLADGAFKVFASTTAEVVVDITGYYAPPGASGLYFHPLPKPIRLLETRSGQPGCLMTGTPMPGGADTIQQGTTTCDSVTIPTAAQALVGNATTIFPTANGFITLYPADAATRPLAASGNYKSGTILNSPFNVGLSPSGQFKIYTVATTDLVIDVLGYYSADATDVNGTGLLFHPLTPVRLLDTRVAATGACFLPGAPLTGGVESLQAARSACTIASTAQAIVGNATTVQPAANGFLTFWPSDAPVRPLAAISNFQAAKNFNRYFTVGLGTDGAFKMYASSTTNLVVDVSGYYAP